MVYLIIKAFHLKLQPHRDKLPADMGWTYCVIWFLCLSVSECWKLLATHGEVQSPQYPQPYLPNMLQQWDLRVPKGYQVQLSLTHLDIKFSFGCYKDSLTVLYDHMILGKFCGQENSTGHPGNESIISQGNTMTLIFQTRDFAPELQQHVGFSATYDAIDMDECSQQDPDSDPLCYQICINIPGSYRCSCHRGYKLHVDQHTCQLSCGRQTFDKHEGHLASPRYPHPSPPSLSCKYIISVEPRFDITLNFTDSFHIDSMDTEQGPRCLHHWLQVTIPNREPMKLCGAKSPGLIDTNSNTVTLEYHTDVKGLSRGWSLDYSTSVGVINCGEPEPLLNGGVTFLSGSQNQHLSVVQYHCNEPFYTLPGGKNVTFTCEADRKWRSNQSSVTPTCVPVCGQPTKLISTYQRILGGSDAPQDTIPWQVLLTGNGIAGGMVIGDRWILTAATSVMSTGNQSSPESVLVFIGGTNVKTLLESPVPAASIHVHPEYNNPDFINYNHDIALIKLQDPITFSSSVMPICLPAEDATYHNGEMGLVSGFGLVQYGERQILTNTLKYLQLPVVDQETCSQSITSLAQSGDQVPDLTNNMFCVGVPEGGKDSCQGDTGGPFALRSGGRFWAAGIVSWGVDCGRQGTYGVYTRVTNYLNWINKTMQEN
ncbi:complement C1r-B subcomponent-like [Centropristis striata]|uniref:complement C1r-B subcomponent-like n=1 Tax=Centropristis striata TaxID=184440 RepID=UPI0027E1B6E6|nr:complement C1r-B subcomponent-like [Centropristis striata]